MLRGHIDEISGDCISGWVFCEGINISGQEILAFAGDQCIGAGRVEIYRPDLEAAGLGDGNLGFVIPFDPHALASGSPISIRLKNSDFMLVPRSDFGRGGIPSRLQHFLPFTEHEFERLQWMSMQGILSEAQHALARALNGPGYYVRTFSRSELAQHSFEGLLAPLMAETASAMFRTHVGADEYRVHGGGMPALSRLAELEVERSVVALYGASFSIRLTEFPYSSSGDTRPIVVKVSPLQALVCLSPCILEPAETEHLSLLSLLDQ